MHEACLLIFLHLYSRERAILLKWATPQECNISPLIKKWGERFLEILSEVFTGLQGFISDFRLRDMFLYLGNKYSYSLINYGEINDRYK